MTEKKMISVLLAWERNYHEAGTYSWAGMAIDEADAVAQARVQAVYDNEVWEEDSGEPMDDYMPTEIVLDYAEGVNLWKANELLDALKAVVAQMKDTGAWQDAVNGEDDALLEAVTKADALIVLAEGREDSA